MKSQILDALREKGDSGLTLKKLQCAIVGDDDEENEEKLTEFTSIIEKLVKKRKIYYEGKKLKLLVDPEDEIEAETPVDKKKKKKSSSHDENDDEEEDTVANLDDSNNNNKKSRTLKGMYPELWRTGEQLWRDNGFDNDYLLQNPDGITRIFCGNLTRTVTEEQLRAHIEDITFIKWITDKDTQQFYGSTFLELKSTKAAATAVLKDKQKFLGRPLKIYYCPPRPNDVWPPREDRQQQSIKPAIQKNAQQQMTEKPEGCRKLYCGNLSYNIDDDTIVEFFKDCGTLTGLRWLTHKDTGDFRVRIVHIYIYGSGKGVK
jgi:nucleolin